MDQWLFQPSIHKKKLLVPDSAAQRSSEQRLNLAVLAHESPFFWRGQQSRQTILVGPDAGAEQWYKTIAKLMQGRNLLSTLTANVVRSWPQSHKRSNELVATWLILPVVICLS